MAKAFKYGLKGITGYLEPAERDLLRGLGERQRDLAHAREQRIGVVEHDRMLHDASLPRDQVAFQRSR